MSDPQPTSSRPLYSSRFSAGSISLLGFCIAPQTAAYTYTCTRALLVWHLLSYCRRCSLASPHTSSFLLTEAAPFSFSSLFLSSRPLFLSHSLFLFAFPFSFFSSLLFDYLCLLLSLSSFFLLPFPRTLPSL